jgi:hypothetical protein
MQKHVGLETLMMEEHDGFVGLTVEEIRFQDHNKRRPVALAGY